MGHLSCAACGRRLTRDCRMGALEEFNADAQDRTPSVPAGIMVRLDGDLLEKGHGCIGGAGPKSSPSGAISTHPDDVIRAAVVASGKYYGCCGADGLDGPNLSCTCGAVLATEWSDCWTQAEIRFLPDAVSLSE